MLFDTHCHLGFHPDLAPGDLVARAAAAGVTALLDVGIDLPSSRAALARAGTMSGVWATAGIHPNDAADWTSVWSEIAELCRREDCTAVGETGLDFFRDHTPHSVQEQSFAAHLVLARDLDKPVVVHCRDAFERTLAVLADHPGVRGVMHCFSGGVNEARTALDVGMYVSLAGPVTYKKNDALREVAAFVPAGRLLVETDAPFLPPQSHRGKGNEPAWVVETAGCVAQARGISFAEVAALTTANGRELFGI